MCSNTIHLVRIVAMWRLRGSAPKVSLEQTVYRIRQGRIQRLQKESRYLEVCEIRRARLTACERLYRYTLKIRNSGVVTASDLVSDTIRDRYLMRYRRAVTPGISSRCRCTLRRWGSIGSSRDVRCRAVVGEPMKKLVEISEFWLGRYAKAIRRFSSLTLSAQVLVQLSDIAY